MKSYLLDTHILLWWLSSDEKLPAKTKELIEDPSNHIIVSAVSIWEIVIKKSLKKLKAPDNIKDILEENHIETLPITADHALFLQSLPYIHQDPFDRLLISQALVEDLVFVTVDKMILKYSINTF
ncbi:MAG TPA: type II toxin-antitoxin system VapC family toxin [Candidatus Babeliales bacterium]|nr:type II toxin-antitoxin system VapC family toxin [Candidatus Babeliales bacterium]